MCCLSSILNTGPHISVHVSVSAGVTHTKGRSNRRSRIVFCATPVHMDTEIFHEGFVDVYSTAVRVQKILFEIFQLRICTVGCFLIRFVCLSILHERTTNRSLVSNSYSGVLFTLSRDKTDHRHHEPTRCKRCENCSRRNPKRYKQDSTAPFSSWPTKASFSEC